MGLIIVVLEITMAIVLLTYAISDLLNNERNIWDISRSIFQICVASVLITMALRNIILYVIEEIVSKL